jgi:probable phosphoglycerate mutase
MQFYFIRHGETDSNAGGLLSGSVDAALNSRGHAQARGLAARIRSLIGHPLHRLLVSDLTRARQTASYLAEVLQLPAEIFPEFREWDLGEWEGKPYADYREAILGDGEPKDGEPRADFYARVARGWRAHHSDSQPYAIVAHGVVWLALQDLLKIERFKVDNCGLVQIRRASDGRWQAQIL